MTSSTITSVSTIRTPTTSRSPYYSTIESFREQSGFVNPSDFPEYDVKLFLKRATEQIKKDAFYKIRWEKVTRSSDGRYFTRKRWWGNRIGNAIDNTEIEHGTITKYDIEVYQADTTSNNAISMFSMGNRINKVYDFVPYDAITYVDSLNGYFKVDDRYPESGKQLFVTYNVCGKPMNDISYELELACNEWATVLALRKIKRTKLYNGTVTFTSGRQTISRDIETFNNLIKSHEESYKEMINYFKPFIGRSVSVGYWETQPPRNVYGSNRY